MNSERNTTSGQTSGDAILRLIKDNPRITRKELSNTLDIAQSAIQKHIKRLKENGILIRVGGDFGGYWEISE